MNRLVSSSKYSTARLASRRSLEAASLAMPTRGGGGSHSKSIQRAHYYSPFIRLLSSPPPGLLACKSHDTIRPEKRQTERGSAYVGLGNCVSCRRNWSRCTRRGDYRDHPVMDVEGALLGIPGWHGVEFGFAFQRQPESVNSNPDCLLYNTTRASPSRRVMRSRSRNSSSGMAYFRDTPVHSLNSGTAKRWPFFRASISRSDCMAVQ